MRGKGTSKTFVASLGRRRLFHIILPGIIGFILSSVLVSAAAGAGSITRASTASDGSEGNSQSYDPSISADGRYIAFVSYATNLVSPDTNGATDVFLKDTSTGATYRLSTDSGGVQGNRHCTDPSISANGRFVAFDSKSDNLVPGDSNGWNGSDIFVKDTQTGQTTRVSTNSDSIEGNNNSYHPSISADGRYVAFQSQATNLVPGDTNGGLYNSYGDIFVKDTVSGQTARVSTNSDGAEANGNNERPSISADGRFVAFQSSASNLVSGDTNGMTDVFVKDTQTGQTTRVSTDSDGAQATSSGYYASISADGEHVAFQSSAANLVPGDTNNTADIFVKDLVTGATIRVSTTSAGEQGNGLSGNGNGWSIDHSISSDGRYVTFTSFASNLVPGGTDIGDIFVKDTLTDDTTIVSTDFMGSPGNAWSRSPSISADGQVVALSSYASNLVPVDTNGNEDVYVAAAPFAASLTKPPLSLARNSIYWASLADYEVRNLSVDFMISNGNKPAYNVNITGATATAGVTCNTVMPASLGNIGSGGSQIVTLNYTVPNGVAFFNTAVSASAQDEYGNEFTYP